MARYRITSPDGRVFDITAPDEPTQEQGLPASIQGIGQGFGSNRTAVESAFGNYMPVNPVTSSLAAGVIGAGRTMDKIAEGTRQVGNATAGVIANDVFGQNPAPFRQALDAQQQEQARNDAVYAGLRSQFPLSTGAGEALPAVAIPVGQATTLGRIAAPAIGLGTMGAAQYGTPQQRAIGGIKGTILGALGGTVGELANTALAPATSRLTGAQQDAVQAAANNLGIVPLPSQMTGNPNLARIEDFLSRVQGGAGVMKDFTGANQRAINRAAAGAMGQNSDSVTTDVFANAKAQQGAARNALQADASMPVGDPVLDAITGAQTTLSRGLRTNGKSEALTLLSDLKDRLYNTKELSGEDLQAITSDLKTAARNTDNMTVAAALKDVQKAMDNASTVNKADLAKNNAQIAARKTLQAPGVVNEITGDVYPGRLAGTMQNQFGESLKTGALNGPLVDIYNYARALPAMRAGSPTFERQATGSLKDWLFSPAYWATAKAMTSQTGREYLAKGLLGNPTLSATAGKVASRAVLPLAVSPAQQALWQMGLLGAAQ